MEIWQAIVTAAGTCAATLIVTYLFNWFTNRPKKRREEQEKQKQAIREDIGKVEAAVTEKVDDLVNILAKSRTDSIKEREKLYATIGAVESRLDNLETINKLQASGLQMLIRNKLREIYTKCIEQGYAPLAVRDDAEALYQIYHKLGVNGVLSGMRDQVLALPIAPEEK